MDSLCVGRLYSLTRVSVYIDLMVKLIGGLVEDGRAYVVEGQGVYFDVTSFPEYGELAHRRLEDLLGSAGARAGGGERQRRPPGLSLSEVAPPGGPAGGPPRGAGRPGRHARGPGV